MINSLFYALTFLNVTAYEAFQQLPINEANYVTHCIVKLGLEENLYQLFDFTYPPIIMDTTQDQTDYAFMTLKYVYMHELVPCIKSLNFTEVEKVPNVLRYDLYHLDFSNYLRHGIRHHYELYHQHYPLFKHHFKVHRDHLERMSNFKMEYRYFVPFGNFLKHQYHFLIERFASYIRRWYI